MSGASRNGRSELATVLEFLRPGDELVVTRLDRLGRDTRDVLNLIHECEQRGAFVTVLDPDVCTRGKMGHVVLTVLGMIAKMDRRSGAAAGRDGIAKAKAEEVYRGGKRRLDHSQIKDRCAEGIDASSIALPLHSIRSLRPFGCGSALSTSGDHPRIRLPLV